MALLLRGKSRTLFGHAFVFSDIVDPPNIDFQLNTIEVKQMPKRDMLGPKKLHLKMFCNGPADLEVNPAPLLELQL